MNIVLATVFWGDWHSEMFRECTMKSLMTPENLSVFDGHVVEWWIWTDQEALEPELQDFPGTVVHNVVDVLSGKRYLDQHKYWRDAYQVAKNKNAVIIFVPPDVIYSKAFLRSVVEKFEDGFLGVVCNGPRVLDDIRDEDTAGISPRKLTELSFEYAHPLMDAHDLDTKNACGWCETAHLRTSKSTWVSRMFGHELLGWDTVGLKVNPKKWCPWFLDDFKAVYVFQDSDDGIYLSVAPREHFSEKFLDRGFTPQDLAWFWRRNPSKCNQELSELDIVWHSEDTESNETIEASKRLDAFVTAGREIFYKTGLQTMRVRRDQ